MRTKTQNIEMVDPKKVLTNMLKTFSGASVARDVKYNMFYQVYAFKGVVPGVGCSTIVANTALALADLGLSVCVFDTSVLHPVQDELLKTNYRNKPLSQRIDWFDMPFTKESPLNISGINRQVSVLSFAGKNRTILDMISTLDSEEMVEVALEVLKPKFDVILVDVCDEPTNVAITSLQKSQQLIQVWSDSIPALASMQATIANNVTVSCPMDKMRYVIENKTCDDTMGNLDALYKEYKFKRLSHCTLSYEIARVAGLGSPLWKNPAVDATIEDFNLMIIDVVVHILGIEKEGLKNGEIVPRRSLEAAVERNEELGSFPLSLDLLRSGKKNKKAAEITQNEGSGVVSIGGNDSFSTDVPDSEQQVDLFSEDTEGVADESGSEDGLNDGELDFTSTSEEPVEAPRRGFFGRRKKNK